MIDPNHPDIEKQLDLEAYAKRGRTVAERQREYRQRQKALGRKPVTMLLTEDERFYVDRVVKQMRETGGFPAMMRNAKGRFEHLDT